MDAAPPKQHEYVEALRIVGYGTVDSPSQSKQSGVRLRQHI